MCVCMYVRNRFHDFYFFFCSCKLLPCFEVSLDVGYTLLLREVSLVSFNTAHI